MFGAALFALGRMAAISEPSGTAAWTVEVPLWVVVYYPERDRHFLERHMVNRAGDAERLGEAFATHEDAKAMADRLNAELKENTRKAVNAALEHALARAKAR